MTCLQNVDEWPGCYAGAWKRLIVPDAFAHPAKFGAGLVQRMLAHALERGWLAKGDVVLDPFGGIGCGGIICAYAGLRWIGVELEPRFVTWAEQSFSLHRRKWSAAGDPHPVIVRGDSRKLAEVLAEVELNPLKRRENCVLSSPPFADAEGFSDRALQVGKMTVHHGGDGQGGTLRPTGRAGSMGTFPGQLGAMRPGDVDAVVSSPPYEATDRNGARKNQSVEHKAELLAAAGHDAKRWLGQRRCTELRSEGYGQSDGQLGETRGDTFWSAAREIVAQCHAVLKPGGHALWVTKDFVRDGARVPFTEDWIRLCEACGFELICRHRAMLVREHTDEGLFAPVTRSKSRKSFFRRLAESKGSPAIDWEDVVCFSKRLET